MIFRSKKAIVLHSLRCNHLLKYERCFFFFFFFKFPIPINLFHLQKQRIQQNFSNQKFIWKTTQKFRGKINFRLITYPRINMCMQYIFGSQKIFLFLLSNTDQYQMHFSFFFFNSLLPKSIRLNLKYFFFLLLSFKLFDYFLEIKHR